MVREPTETHVSIHDIDLAVWHWPGELPAIVLCHPTGFHARCWDQIVARLPNRLCIAPDFRGHGRSSKPQPPYHWRSFGEDVAGLLREWDIRDAVGVGHSMGGHATVLAAALQPRAFARLLLLDPVIRPRAAYTGPVAEVDFVLRRRNFWDSPEQMFERFQSRPPFQSWDAAILRDYCNFGLLPAATGDGFVLACPPAIEASIYAHNSERQSDLYAEIQHIQIPVHIIRSSGEFGASNFQASPTAPDLASFFPHGQDTPLTGATHFFPMEAPGLTAQLIAAS
ncbi:MAG: alpha/beta fold hydrolase [Bryobacteraceae bacterium]